MRLVKIRYECPSCNSDNLLWDAHALWDEIRQRFCYDKSDYCYCTDCGDEINPRKIVTVNKKLLRINVL